MLVIYSKENCQQCDTAKLLCQVKGWEFETKLLNLTYTREDLLNIAPHAKSFPVIFYGDKLVGGLTELKTLLK